MSLEGSILWYRAVDKRYYRFISFSQLAATLIIVKITKLGHETYGSFGY